MEPDNLPKDTCNLRKDIGGSLLITATAIMMSGCMVHPEPITDVELNRQVKADRVIMFADVEPIQHPLTLAEAIARALRYNLDHRVKVMEAVLAQGQLDMDFWEMLPKMTTAAGYSGRSNTSASVSQSIRTGTTSLEASTSQDRDRLTHELGFSWNILDFGLSYYNARQNADRVLIAEERRNKVVHSLVQEVRATFWRAAAAQRLKDDVTKAMRQSEAALKNSRQSEKEGLRSPLEALHFQRALLENLRQLETVEAELANGMVELCGMINLPPSTPFTLVLPDDNRIQAPEWKMPVAQMEEVALLRNPDLRETAYQTRISVDDTHKALLKLLPGISFTHNTQHDTNSFLINKGWSDAGARISFNLLNLLSATTYMDAAEAGLEVTHAKRQALHMAVLTQVQLARRQYELAVKQFNRAATIQQVDRSISQHTANRQEEDAQSQLERIATNTAAIISQLRRYQTLAEVHAAIGRMQSTLGADLNIGDPRATDLPTLIQQIETLLAAKEAPLPKPTPDVATAPSPASTRTLAEQPVQAEPAGLIKSATNVRSGPGLHYGVVRVLATNEPVRLVKLDENGHWGQLPDNGWIAVNQVQLVPPAKNSADA